MNHFAKTFTEESRGQMPATDMKFPREGKKDWDSTKPDDQGIGLWSLTRAPGDMEPIQ